MKPQKKDNLVNDELMVLLNEWHRQRKEKENENLKMMPADLLHGFLTAIVIGPGIAAPSKWLSYAFGNTKEMPTFANENQMQTIISLLLSIYNCVLQTINNDTFVPVFSYVKEDGVEKEDVSVWCFGFFTGVSVFGKEKWDYVNNEYLAELCLPIFSNVYTLNELLLTLYKEEQLKKIESIGDKKREIITDAVYKIRDYFIELQKKNFFGLLGDNNLNKIDLTPKRNEKPKIGRNDPCPCGSGKKYKKCCGKEL